MVFLIIYKINCYFNAIGQKQKNKNQIEMIHSN